MHRIIVTLPENRDYAGTLRLEDEDGDVVAGPFAVCGRADEAAARRHGNASRNPLLPFGDTPLGRYRIEHILPSGTGTQRPADRYGPHGVIVLTPTAGDAALADANGRFHLLIQGGAAAPGQRLRPTNGSLRLGNREQKQLIDILRDRQAIVCELLPMPGTAATRPIATDEPSNESDPPLHASAGAVGITSASGFPAIEASGLRSPFAPPTVNFLPDGSGGGGGSNDSDYNGDDQNEKQVEKESTVRGLLHRVYTSGSSAAQKAIKEAPAKVTSALVDKGISALNSQHQMTADQAGTLRKALNDQLTPQANKIGQYLSDQLRSALDGVPAGQANTPFPTSQPTPKVTPDLNVTVGAGRFTYNSKGNLGVNYTAQDFLNFAEKPGLQTAFGPFTTNLNKLSLSADYKTGNWTFGASGHATISNPAGTLIHDFNVMGTAKFQF
jgi:hypothetical protein